jgi:hypothetical protein
MLTGNGQNGKAKRWLESRLEGKPRRPFLGIIPERIIVVRLDRETQAQNDRRVR